MAANLVASPRLRTASAPFNDAPHRRRGTSYPEARRSDPKHGVFLNQDTCCYPLFAIQLGTGRPFSRKNGTLNILL